VKAVHPGEPMHLSAKRLLAFAALTCAFSTATLRAQDVPATDSSEPAARRQRVQGGDDNGPRPVFGRIAAIQDNAIRITDINGAEVTIKVTSQTEFRKDRQPAALKNFKVGDGIIVRGDENSDHTVTAKVISGRSAEGGPNGGGGRGGHGFGGGGPMGTIGKDFVVGEVQSVEAPSLTVVRTDKVKQTLELNEETSLRKGPDSVTMADIHVGDHIFARGALQDNQFVPKSIVVIGPEQWKRIQEAGVAETAGSGKHNNAGDTQSKPPTGPQN
jgi:hypothetical protein